MRIGNHVGRRAIYNNSEGYFFETIGELTGTLFVYDDKIGHDAQFYFEKHPEEWNDELKSRCRYVSKYVSKREVTLTKKKVII